MGKYIVLDDAYQRESEAGKEDKEYYWSTFNFEVTFE